MINPPKTWNNPQKHYLEVLDSDWYHIISSLQAKFVKYTVDYYNGVNYDFMLLPITTGAISSPMGLGSDSSPVEIQIQGIKTYLADSMQFFLEYACRINKKGCYYLAPSFRGEPADKRHLSQFYHSEAEITGNLDDIIIFVEEYLRFLVKHYLKEDSSQISLIAGNVDHLKKFLSIKSFPRCTFDEAVVILKNDKACVEYRNGYRKINSLGEKRLMEYFDGFVWLTHFDHLSVPFYQKGVDGKFEKAVCADFLFGIGETVGSGERLFDGNDVLKALKYHKVSPESYKWYIDVKNKVPLQTSGFGLGVERFLLWMLKHDDIRDIQIVPRFNGIKSIL